LAGRRRAAGQEALEEVEPDRGRGRGGSSSEREHQGGRPDGVGPGPASAGAAGLRGAWRGRGGKGVWGPALPGGRRRSAPESGAHNPPMFPFRSKSGELCVPGTHKPTHPRGPLLCGGFEARPGSCGQWPAALDHSLPSPLHAIGETIPGRALRGSARRAKRKPGGAKLARVARHRGERDPAILRVRCRARTWRWSGLPISGS
jgi:hypothetical protein